MDWLKEMRKAQDAQALALPELSPTMWMYSDVGRRSANCKHCKGVIPKNVKRAVVLMRLRIRYSYKNGGSGSGQKYYVHTECVNAVLGGEVEGRLTTRCYSCRDEIGESRQHRTRHMFMTGTSTGYAELCDQCSNLPCFQRCDVCGVWNPKYNVSPIVSTGSYTVGSLCCDTCAEVHDLTTLKQKKRREKADIRFERKLDKIKAYYHDYTEAENSRESVGQD